MLFKVRVLMHSLGALGCKCILVLNINVTGEFLYFLLDIRWCTKWIFKAINIKNILLVLGEAHRNCVYISYVEPLGPSRVDATQIQSTTHLLSNTVEHWGLIFRIHSFSLVLFPTPARNWASYFTHPLPRKKQRLEKLLEGESGNDALLELIWNNIGDYHFDRQSWDKAVVYYSKAKKCEKLAECFYALGDWDSLGEMVTTLHEGSPLLPTLAKKFFHAGICKHAVSMSPSNPTWCFTLFNFNLSSVKACACTFNCIPLTKLLVKSAKSS